MLSSRNCARDPLSVAQLHAPAAADTKRRGPSLGESNACEVGEWNRFALGRRKRSRPCSSASVPLTRRPSVRQRFLRARRRRYQAGYRHERRGQVVGDLTHVLSRSPGILWRIDCPSIIYAIHRTPYIGHRGLLVADRPRFLVLGDSGVAGADWLRRCGLEGDVVHADSWNGGLAVLRREHLDALLANPADVLGAAPGNARAVQNILATLPDGVAVVDFDLHVRWANPTFKAWCGGRAVGRGFYEALGSPGTDRSRLLSLPHRPVAAPGSARTAADCDHAACTAGGNRHIDLHITPVHEAGSTSRCSSSWAATSPPRCSSSRSSTPCTRPAGNWPPWRRISLPR